MIAGRTISLVFCAWLALCSAHARAQESEPTRVGVENVTPAFRVGQYMTLSVNPSDPLRVAIGLADGRVAWSNDGGMSSSEATVISPRVYSVMALRGFNMRRREYSRAHPQRGGTRLFQSLLHKGLPVTRMALWMNIEDVMPDIAQIALGPGDGPMAVASATGLWVSDRHRSVWMRMLGGPRPKKKDIEARSVAINPQDPSHMLVATDDGMWVSHNGGSTVSRLADCGIDEDERISRIIWDPGNGQHLFATGPGVIYVSEDGGKKFSPELAVEGDINDLVLGEKGAYIATTGGLVQLDENGERTTTFKEQNVVGVISLGEGDLLVATDSALHYVFSDGTRQTLMHTSVVDPLIALRGSAQLGWAITSHSVLRIGPRAVRKRSSNPPKMKMTLAEVERAITQRRRLGGDPSKFRFNERWYSKLLPMLSVRVKGIVGRNYSLIYDASKIQGSWYRATAGSESYCCGTPYMDDPSAVLVMAHWSLATLLFGETSNPNGMLEAGLRDLREGVLRETRWRYVETERLVSMMQRPPVDPQIRLQWKMRLEEHVGYLEGMADRKVVEMNEMEE